LGKGNLYAYCFLATNFLTLMKACGLMVPMAVPFQGKSEKGFPVRVTER